MILLALGVNGDFFVAARKIMESGTAALMTALGVVLFVLVMWFGVALYRRNQERSGQAAEGRDGRQFAS